MLFLKSISKRGGGAKWISGRWMNINNGVKRWEVTAFVRPCWTKTETMKGYDQTKENRSLSPWAWMVPILKLRCFSCLLRLSLPPKNGWDGTNFYIGNKMVSSIKISRNRFVNIIVSYGTKVFSKFVRKLHFYPSTLLTASWNELLILKLIMCIITITRLTV